MSEEKELKMIRLKFLQEDLVGLVTFHGEYLTIERPLAFQVDTDYEEGKQILTIREYLPQSVISIKEVDFDMDQVLFTSPVRKEFKDQYDDMAEFFYEKQPAMLEKNKEKREILSTRDNEKIVSLLEALRDKKNKPVH
jgi:hypothetical protein